MEGDPKTIVRSLTQLFRPPYNSRPLRSDMNGCCCLSRPSPTAWDLTTDPQHTPRNKHVSCNAFYNKATRMCKKNNCISACLLLYQCLFIYFTVYQSIYRSNYITSANLPRSLYLSIYLSLDIIITLYHLSVGHETCKRFHLLVLWLLFTVSM